MKLQAWDIGTEITPCYVTVMRAKDIFNLSRVSRVDDNNGQGYQRYLSEKRVKDVSDYLDNGNVIPGSIILSAQENFNISFDKGSSELTIGDNDGYLFVIDGQHRLAGAYEAEREILLPVCIFTNLKLYQEVQYFLDINSNQKGVPKTLRIELLKFLSEPDSKDALLNKLFKDLGNDIDSALYNRTSATKSVRGKLSHVPFREAIEPLIDSGSMNKFDYEGKRNLLVNYLGAVEKTIIKIDDNSDRLTTSAFFQAIFKIFDEVCEYCLTYFKSYQQSAFEEILLGLRSIDFEKHQGSNKQTITNLSDEMSTLIRNNTSKLTIPNDLF